MKILLIFWYFPPLNDVGAIRASKMAEFLHDAGHTVHVLTAARQSNDTSLTTTLPEDHITRTSWYNVDHIGVRLRRRDNAAAESASPKGRLWAFASEQFRHLIRMPDQQVGWLPFLHRAGKAILEQDSFDLIYASGPPFTAFLGAHSLARSFNLPWVAGYRDGWSRDVYERKPQWRHAIDELLENRTVRTAAGIVTVSEPWAEYYMARFQKPSITIYNGFDPVNSLDHLKAEPARNSALTIAYFGIMYEGLRDPSTLYEAIRLSGLRPTDVQVLYYGPKRSDILPLAKTFGMTDYVSVRDRVSYSESLKIQRMSDVLLLLQSPADPRNVPAKTFEYFAALRPILGLGLDEGIPARLVRERNAGIYITDAQAVAKQLKRWLEEKRRSGTVADLPECSREGLSRIDQLHQFESFLSSLVAENMEATRAQCQLTPSTQSGNQGPDTNADSYQRRDSGP
jgi:glycosyltransferase involved in cell wall biosynthesis